MPGAVLALSIWIGGSWCSGWILESSAGGTSIYGPLAAPIAVLVWLFVTSMAVLIGAAFNAAIDFVWPRLSGIDHSQVAYADSTVPPKSPRLAEVLDADSAENPIEARTHAHETSRHAED